MRVIRTILIASFVSATTAVAQAPATPPASARAGGTVPAARMLLAHTGELGLTDAQVVRLAAIERRSEARRATLRAQLDSGRQRFETQRADTAARRQFRERMRTSVDRATEQSRTDMRDAIAVLTADQQAKAWELVARRGGAGRGMRGAEGMRMNRMRRPGGMDRGFAPRRQFRDDDMPTRRPQRDGGMRERRPRPPEGE